MVDHSSHRRFVLWLPALAAAVLLGSLAFAAGSASAEPYGAPILSYSTEVSTTQAGAHPDMTLDFAVHVRGELPRFECGCAFIKDALVETPAGFIGNPHATPTCTAVQFGLGQCPVDAQVGEALPSVALAESPAQPVGPEPIYNLVPLPGQAGLLAWKAPILGFPVYIVIGARTGSDYGLNAEVKGITGENPLGAYHQELWGVPASPAHDDVRGLTVEERIKGGIGVPSNSPEKPFLSNPTYCSGPLTSTLTSTAYDHGVDKETAPWPAVTGCEKLRFNPTLSGLPTTRAADSASGFDVNLKVPQNDSPDTPSDSEIRANRVVLPEGFAINPSAADGKVSCSDAQARLGSEEEAQCPEFSKVGTFRLDSWALPTPIYGGVFLGDPKPGDRYRTILTADGYGTHIKVLGSSFPNPRTGQIESVFENLPQAPYTEYDLHFFGSERGLFATPSKCGTYAVETEFEPWARELPNQRSTQFFTIDSGPNGSPCPSEPRAFKPAFRAAGTGNGAGAHSPFSIYISRQDGDQTLSTIGVNTPPGFTATLKGVGKCSDQTVREVENEAWSGRSEMSNPKCPAASQVGYSNAGAGAGSKPYNALGKVYLTGPYKGAPLSFTVITPAVSGPYDLGNVVNRVAVKVDSNTAAVTAVSDPLPQIIGGIPLRLRSVLINLDRKNFTLNPTNCDPFQVTGLLTGDQGAKTEPQSRFQVANCETLDYAPKLRTVVKGPVKRGGYPAFTATLTQDPSEEANTAKAVVTLPHSEFLAQNHIKTICTRVQFAVDKCPAGSIYGQAKAITPLLDEPVEGPVYLRASTNPLPDLVAALKGPPSLPLEVNLVGKIDSPNQEIRTTFAAIPDTPVSKFTLSMFGGKRGLLENSTNICANRQRVDARLTGQNGASANQKPALKAPCKSAARKKRAAAKKKAAKRAANDNGRAGK